MFATENARGELSACKGIDDFLEFLFSGGFEIDHRTGRCAVQVSQQSISIGKMVDPMGIHADGDGCSPDLLGFLSVCD